MSAQTFGRAGASLLDGSFAVSTSAVVAKGAAQAEARTAQVLDTRSGDRAVILHDLDIPVTFADGGRPNIDHAILIETTLWLIDSKWWKPGFLWTLGSTTRRGWRHFPAADKQTMTLARDAVMRHLATNGIHNIRVRCAVVIWPTSSKTRMSTWAMRFPGSVIISADRFGDWVAARTRTSQAADPHAQLALMRLLRHA